MSNPSYRQKRCKHGFVDISQCEICTPMNANLVQLLNAAYLAGFNDSAEGWNGEYPFSDNNIKLTSHDGWMQDRDKAINKLLSKES